MGADLSHSHCTDTYSWGILPRHTKRQGTYAQVTNTILETEEQ